MRSQNGSSNGTAAKPEIDQIESLFNELKSKGKLSAAKWEKIGALGQKLTRGSAPHTYKLLAQVLMMEHPEIRKGIRKAQKQGTE
jgi:hypothetical protein